MIAVFHQREMEDGRNSSTGEKKKVMVAIDESDCSIYALEWTLSSLHESIANSELLIFTAQPIADYSYLHASSMGATSEFLSLLVLFLIIPKYPNFGSRV